MNLSTVFRGELLRIGVSSKVKDAVLREIARLVHRSNMITAYSEEDLFRALLAREQFGSTGFGGGVAIPHCSLDNLDDFVVGMITEPKGIDFEAVDGKKVFVVVFIIGPKNQRNRHIQLLSNISKLLKSRKTLDRLLKAGSNEEILGVIKDASIELEVEAEAPASREQCLFQVFIQREEFFDEILQVFTAAADGAVVIIEAQNAGAYLHRLPLFSAFWTEESNGSCRIILSVVEKGVCNDIIRRINLIVDDINRNPGVLVSVQDLMFTGGSLDFS
jgi:mannitol/fructose-specific phosphotransferase system IIA component (Ntr-type)